MQLPIIKTPDQILSLIQTKWASIINPVLDNPVTNPSFLKGIVITTGVNKINHLLARKQQGWVLTDIDAAATLYRSQPFDDKILTLTSNANCTINLLVY